MGKHWFWLALTIAVLVWYSTVAIYVAIRGALDVRHMLARLKQIQERPGASQGPA